MSEKQLDVINEDKNLHLDQTRKLTLKDFPPLLRKVALVMLESETKMTITGACTVAKVNAGSAIQLIHRQRKKGKNFYDLLNKELYEELRNKVHSVDLASYEKGLEGTHKDRELFYKRFGFIQDTVTHEHKHIHLHHSAPLPAIAMSELEEED